MPVFHPRDAFLVASLAFLGTAVAVLVYSVAKNPASIPPLLGARGMKRQRASAENETFRTFEPLIRFVAGWVSRIDLTKVRRRIDEKLIHGGDWLGLTPDEFIAIRFLSGLVGFGVGLALSYGADMDAWVILVATYVFQYLPMSRLNAEVALRFKQVNRSLPMAIDLASLCMGAGLDFPGALRQITDKSGTRDALHEELLRILQELELGRTRRQALESFAERCPTEAVRDFVGAVVQAEEKGNPLAEVLRIQAGMLRMRRSVAAEEGAAKAAVMMMLPLMLIFCSVFIIMLGPFVINAMNTGF